MAISRKSSLLLAKLLLLITATAASYLLLFFNSFDCEKYNYSFYPALRDKIKLIKSTPSPKIVFIGGSNIAYGLDSGRIAKETGLPVINMGLTAGLGLKFMLDQVKPYLNRHDMVVIVPEYHHFVGNFLYGNNELLVASELLGDYSMAFNHPLPGIINYMLGQNTRVLRYILTSSLNYLPRAVEKSLLDLTETTTCPLTYFNEHGDVIICKDRKPVKQLESYPMDDKINELSIKFLSCYVSDNNDKGIKTVLLYPALQKKYYTAHQCIIKKISDSIKSTGILSPSSPEDFLYGDEDMLDTVYHLNDNGKGIRTNKVIEIMNKFIN
jgi:hypothetical protein